MTETRRLVLDTNVLVSGMLFAGSAPARAIRRAQSGIVLLSEATQDELLEVLNRKRFDRYVDAELRRELAASYIQAAVKVKVDVQIRACRDPRDDKFLELAVCGRADRIVSGDADLLTMHGFRGIAIVSPAEFLDEEKVGQAQDFKD